MNYCCIFHHLSVVLVYRIRTRAIQGFSQCLSSSDEGIIGVLKEIVTPKTSHRNAPPRLVPTPGVGIRQEPRTGETKKSIHFNLSDHTVNLSFITLVKYLKIYMCYIPTLIQPQI